MAELKQKQQGNHRKPQKHDRKKTPTYSPFFWYTFKTNQQKEYVVFFA